MSSSIVLQPGREKSLLRRHPWVFASAVNSTSGKLRKGDTVDIFSSDGQWLAKGAWSPESQIQVRVWSFDRQQVIDNGFFLNRIETAYAGRKALIDRYDLSGFRLVASESDGLPGVTIDCYDRVLVCQLLSAGADKHRDKIVWALKKLFPDHSILERSDVAVREKEGLAQVTQVLHGDVPDETVIEENGVKILVNVNHGHKTGFYLDQRDNRRIAAEYASGKTVLNCFSYTGAFSTYAVAAGAAHVTNIDVSDLALETARLNLELNQLPVEKATFINKDVFQALRDYANGNTRFDLVILDPPKFVDSKASLNRASRGYKDINLHGMKVINPGGILCTFSCSGLMSFDLFQKIVADAALDAGRQVQFLRRLEQAEDHPISSAYPEGFYLKGLVCRVI